MKVKPKRLLGLEKKLGRSTLKRGDQVGFKVGCPLVDDLKLPHVDPPSKL